MEECDSNQDEEELVEAARKGDTNARNVLFMQHKERIHAVCWAAREQLSRRTGANSPVTSDDIDQQSFIIFCKLLQRWEPEKGTFKRYLRNSMRWKALHYVRSALRYRSKLKVLRLDDMLDTGEDEPESAEAEQSLDEVEDKADWDDQTEDLDPEWKRLIEMRYAQGLSSEEIAAVRGYSSRTVNRELRAATDALRKKMQDGWEDCG